MTKILHKNVLQINVFLSKVADQLYIGVDTNKVDMTEFGISPDKFIELSNKLDLLFKTNLGYENE